jgi:hypothetical protein
MVLTYHKSKAGERNLTEKKKIQDCIAAGVTAYRVLLPLHKMKE